jgi:TorA maturation chaperone TorD
MMIGDRELLSFRQGYYSLLVSLFWKEPAREVLLSLADGIKERIDAARNLHTHLAQGWEEIDRFLTKTPSEEVAEAVADEFTRLFIGPHGVEINPYESFYLTGRLLDRPLADLRTFLKAIGIEKIEGYAEPEDFLAFELEVMRWLTGMQKTASQPEEEKRWLQLEADFLREHLLVWVPTCAQEIERAQGANFYRGAALLLGGYLEVERSLFQEWGLGKAVTLEEARQRYGAIPMWKGPTFDFSGDKPEAPLPSRGKQ